MPITATTRSSHWPRACVLAFACALAMNSVAALAAGPFAYVPSNSTSTNTFSKVDLSTETAVGQPISVDLDGTTTGTTTGFFGVTVSAATGMLYISDDGHTESVFQIDTSKIGTASNPTVKQYFVGNNSRGMAVDPSGKHVFVAQFGVPAVSVLDTTVDNSHDHTLGITQVDLGDLSGLSAASPYDVKLNLAGTVAYVSDSSTNQRVCRFNAASPPASVSDSDCVAVGIDPNSESANPTELAVSPDGTRVYVVNRNENSISVIDTTQVDPTTKRPMLTVSRSFKLALSGNIFAGPNGIAINRSGRRAYVGTSLGHILSIDLRLADDNQGATPPEPVVHDLTNPAIFSVQGMAISADGRRLLAADSDNSKLHFVNIVNDADAYDTGVTVNRGPKSYGQFTTPDDRIFVSEIGSTAAGG
jgi:DNA-binding beta-propeller fold protein YncE